MLSVSTPHPFFRLLALALLLTCLLGAMTGCINNSTTNPPDAPDTSDADNGDGDTDTDPDDNPTPNDSGPDTGLKMLANGGGHICAIKNRDNSLWCWGLNSFGQLGDLTTNSANSFKAINADGWHTISTGDKHTCGIKSDDTLWCWGLNESGQLGSGSTASSSEPLDITPDTSWLQVDTGSNHTCAIRDDSTLWCWGDNTRSQLGDGILSDQTEDDDNSNNLSQPKQIGIDTDWIAISLGDEFSCGIRAITNSDKRIYCWGENDSGQLSLGPVTNPVSAPQDTTGATNWTAVSTGDTHTCAIKSDQSLHCWGDNTFGQLGQGDDSPSFSPVEVTSSTPWTNVATGNGHTCGIKSDATLWCWGNNTTGQLGVGNSTHQPTPIQVNHDNDWLDVFAGDSTSCAIDSEYIGYCWGLNEDGQLAKGLSTETDRPRIFDESDNWDSLDSGVEHTCGLKNESGQKTLWCGGGNSFGQLGISSTDNKSVAVQLKGANGLLEYWNSISTGHHHTCAIDENQALYCWGKNSHNQLATNSTNNVAANWSLQKIEVPADPNQVDDWLVVDAGASHTCGIKETDNLGATRNTLYCWGDNSTGQIGNNGSGAGLRVSTPTQITNDMWLDVAVGGYIDATHTEGGHTCGIKIAAPNITEGELWCWGQNNASQLGNEASNTDDETAPIKIGFDADWVSIDAGNQHTCALKSNDTLHCWGAHSRGQIGVAGLGGSSLSDKPLQVSGTWKSYDLGHNSSCAIDKTSSNLLCWGDNSTMQLTSKLANENGRVSTPDAATFLSPAWEKISMGKTHSCGIHKDDLNNHTTYCWGEGAQYQLGDGNAWKETPQRLSLE